MLDSLRDVFAHLAPWGVSAVEDPCLYMFGAKGYSCAAIITAPVLSVRPVLKKKITGWIYQCQPLPLSANG